MKCFGSTDIWGFVSLASDFLFLSVFKYHVPVTVSTK